MDTSVQPLQRYDVYLLAPVLQKRTAFEPPFWSQWGGVVTNWLQEAFLISEKQS
jgi:hypothetical protein